MILFAHILIPFTYIVLALLVKSLPLKRILAGILALANLAFAITLLSKLGETGMIKTQMGSWQAPYGITLVADRFSAIMLLVSAIVFTVTTFYSFESIDRERQKKGFFLFTFGILMGVNGSFIAGDIFNLYVWFEVMLMSSFILVSFGGERPQLEGAIKYLILNLISSFFFVAGIGILYGKIGTLNLAQISERIALSKELISTINPSLILFFVGFAIKGALFPFFFWLPASYHTPPPAVTALFAGLLTKVGIYSIIRIYTLFMYHGSSFWSPVILTLGVLSMVVGVLTATSQFDFRKILSFHIISQVGYIIIGLAFFTHAGITAAIFFLVHNMISKTNTFLVAGWVHKRTGDLNLKTLGDVFKQNTLWGLLFFISAFSLAGMPLLSGFVGKYLIIKSGIEANQIVVSLIALFVGLFTLFSMVKIWLEVFWKPQPEGKTKISYSPENKEYLMLGSSIVLAFCIVAIGLWPAPLVNFCEQAATDLLNPEKYIRFILY
jgi:multicomponent Na+:H+ antiporter subunit D